MTSNSTTLRLNFLFYQLWNFDMLPNSHLKVSYTFIITGLIVEVESTLTFIGDTSVCSFGIQLLKRKAFDNLFWLLNKICNLQQLCFVRLTKCLKMNWSLFLNMSCNKNDNGFVNKLNLYFSPSLYFKLLNTKMSSCNIIITTHIVIYWNILLLDSSKFTLKIL